MSNWFDAYKSSPEEVVVLAPVVVKAPAQAGGLRRKKRRGGSRKSKRRGGSRRRKQSRKHR